MGKLSVPDVVPRLLYVPLLIRVTAGWSKVNPAVSGATTSYELLGIVSALLLVQIVFPNRFVWWVFAIVSGLYLAVACVVLYRSPGEISGDYAQIVACVITITILSIHRFYMR